MSNFWVGDDSGRVLGPVTLQVIRDLLARGRLQRLVRASRDGATWVALSEVPELAALVAPTSKAPAAPSFSDQEARASAEIARIIGRSPSEVLGLPPRATLAEARAAFFAKVKPYHPSQLPPGASDALRASWVKLNELLSSAVAQFKPEAPPAAAPVAAGPFGGWRQEPGQGVRIELNVTPDRASIFTDVPAASLSNGGFFLPSEKSLPLFQTVEVRLHFQAPTRVISGAARVVCEVNQPNKRGIGVRFAALSAEDKRFIDYFVRRVQPLR